MKTPRTDKIQAARFQLEASTGNVLQLVRRNEFIGDPVTTFEEKIRQQRDRLIARELAAAKRAIAMLEEAARA